MSKNADENNLKKTYLKQLYMQDTGSYIIYLRVEACDDLYFTRIPVKINL